MKLETMTKAEIVAMYYELAFYTLEWKGIDYD